MNATRALSSATPNARTHHTPSHNTPPPSLASRLISANDWTACLLAPLLPPGPRDARCSLSTCICVLLLLLSSVTTTLFFLIVFLCLSSSTIFTPNRALHDNKRVSSVLPRMAPKFSGRFTNPYPVATSNYWVRAARLPLPHDVTTSHSPCPASIYLALLALFLVFAQRGWTTTGSIPARLLGPCFVSLATKGTPSPPELLSARSTITSPWVKLPC